jgi:hypothetical protein
MVRSTAAESPPRPLRRASSTVASIASLTRRASSGSTNPSPVLAPGQLSREALGRESGRLPAPKPLPYGRTTTASPEARQAVKPLRLTSSDTGLETKDRRWVGHYQDSGQRPWPARGSPSDAASPGRRCGGSTSAGATRCPEPSRGRSSSGCDGMFGKARAPRPGRNAGGRTWSTRFRDDSPRLMVCHGPAGPSSFGAPASRFGAQD